VSLDAVGRDLEPDFDSFLAVAEEALARRERFAAVIDLTGNRADAVRRRRLAAWSEEHRAEVRLRVAAIGVVAGGAFERGVLTALLWLTRPPMPVRAFSAPADALAWVRGVLASERPPRASPSSS
jgi:hypothetical protein